ncbi:MAG: translocation/assembly module TamB domain-containing protein [Hyphomonadaceae bacterium]
MSEEAPLKPRRRKRWWAFAGGGALVGASAVIALGPAAHLVVDSLGDGARVWRLGRIKIDDVSGGWIGNLRAGTITIEDEEGIWLEAHDVALDWSPQDILFGTVRLHAASANAIAITRQPTLLEHRPSSGATFDVIISELHVERLTLAEAVVGNASEFSADLALDLRDDELRALDLTLRRLDSDDDRITALYHNDQNYALSLDLYSAPGGVIARAIGLSEEGIRATATGDGDLRTGNAHFEAVAGQRQLLIGNTRWTPEAWSAQGQAQLDSIPALQTLAQRIGPSITFNLNGAPTERTFEARAETPFFALNLSGLLDEHGELDGAAQLVATTNNLSAIARESPFPLGAARLEGELRRARGTTAIRGTLDAQEIDALGQRTQLRGPVEAALTADRFTLSGDLRAPARTAPLFVNARLRTALEYDRRRERFTLNRTDLASDAVALDAQGWVNSGDGEFAGDWRIRRFEAVAADLRGEASGRWRAFRDGEEQERAWAISVDGQGARIAGSPDIVPQLLGASPRLDARMRYENGGITVSHARVDGAQLRAGATGRIVGGEANLALEASARGPLDLGGAEIGGAIDATGRLTGRIARPTLTMQGSLSSFAAGGVLVEQPVVNFTLAPRGNAYAGRAEVTGTASGQAMTASADVSIGGGAVSLSALDAQWGGLLAQGSAQFLNRGVNAELDVNGAVDGLLPGVTGRLAGDLTLTPETILLDAQVADARAGELRVRAATLRAEGPLDSVATTFDMRGRLRQAPLAFAGTATVNLDEQSARIEGRGTLADAPIFTRAPITADWSAGRTQAELNVAMGDGVVQAQWEERGRALTGSAQIEDAPLAPLAAIWGERATGRIDGRVSLASNGGGLTGEADIRLDDARVSGRQRGTLDMHIVGNLTPGRLTSTVDATSEGGLVAHFEANAPVETSAAPLRIALARERRGRARWSVRGPADALWAAARLPDQSLSGALDGEGEIEFGAGYLSGDGHLEIVDGRFEDKLTGVRLVDLDARVALDERGVTIENFTASGPRGGRLTATGGSVNDRQGSITVDVDNMRVADRPDAHAVASGELTLAWEGLRSSLTGELNIVEASIDIASNPQAGIPTLDVIEINRPGEEDEPLEEEERPRRNGSTTLNVTVTAPGRVFTRGRGVDAEWALDMRLGGTAAHPLVFGVARAVRGTLALSGQPFEIEDARIEFTGDPLDAQINMTAVRDTADLSARIRLIGTARDPEITFSSEPALPEDEILPQVLFGRSVEDLSALEAAQLAASLAALSGRTSLDLMDAARAAAGLDRFNVRQDEDGGFLVAGGVYLTRDVYVEVARTGLGQAQTRLEWTIRPRLVLITSFLGNGDQRVSLRWRRETD